MNHNVVSIRNLWLSENNIEASMGKANSPAVEMHSKWQALTTNLLCNHVRNASNYQR